MVGRKAGMISGVCSLNEQTHSVQWKYATSPELFANDIYRRSCEVPTKAWSPNHTPLSLIADRAEKCSCSTCDVRN